MGQCAHGPTELREDYDETFTFRTGTTILDGDLQKAIISILYMFLVSWLNAFIMVIVHQRTPDMKKYPPLPDIFLDNIPYIPWGFAICELTATVMGLAWVVIVILHTHRFILIRRFFAITGTVFLLRSITIIITSLSVPGDHLQCNNDFTHHNSTLFCKFQTACYIWSGAGLSIQGVRTCGDYMFSGHTSALTLLNFFITEYTPRHLYFIHTTAWVMNVFGIFFILAAHEHYSIDVFIAFYITSRLFLYYHTLANNQTLLLQGDASRFKIWFPLFSFFESDMNGMIPNKYETPFEMFNRLLAWAKTQWHTEEVADEVIQGDEQSIFERDKSHVRMD